MDHVDVLPEVGAMCHDDTRAYSPVRDVLDHIGDKWTLLVLGMLERGPQRFTALHRSIPGISQRMLTRTLRNLQRDGLVSRQSFDENPPRVEYTVTTLGQTLVPAVIALARWAFENHKAIEANRDAYDETLN
jgi:DNA-binding HxlR family transcriptional regulator